MKILLITLLNLFCSLSVVGQSLYSKSIVMIAHDHRFRTENFDGKNDFNEMIQAGITVKTVCLTTDIQDWNNGRVVRLESDSAIQKTFGYSNWTNFFEGRLNTLLSMANKNNSNIMIVKNVHDIYRAKRDKKAGILIGTEGIKFLNGSLEKLKTYYKMGLRHIQLYREPVAPGAAITSEGVTQFGYDLIRQCNQLGIAIDVTHIQNLANGTEILSQVIRVSAHPVIFSHQHSKIFGAALTDEQIIAAANSGGGHGIIAFHLIESFVKPADVKTLVEIIKHIKDLVGINHVAIGADYSPTDSYHWVLKDYHEFPKLVEALQQAGFSEADIQKILGLNLLQFYKRSWN